MIDLLIQQAITASNNAYVPYSEFPVGAVLRATDGTLFSGCNVENAVYPVTICAERTALVKAVSEGYHSFDLIVVVTRSGGSPCGMCRQMLYEFSPDMQVVMADFKGHIHHQASLRELLPLGFSPIDLLE
ncbi:MAG: cytidine deaminase [Phototrophicales bacterium]|nr:MAG: cytidine deaminase [Phototrophicales bacterium]RMG77571.1 MAG: cytidine deaminase [Chloroflexota bacterium]